MLKFGSDFFQNALDLGWAVTRGAYKVVLTKMEAGLVDWENLEAVQSLRRQYAQRCINKPAQNGSASGPPSGPFKSGNSKMGKINFIRQFYAVPQLSNSLLHQPQ